jgi:hypothetical protein
MGKTKKIFFYTIFGIILLVAWFFIYGHLYQITHPGVTAEKLLITENYYRITDLSNAYKIVIKYIQLTKQNPNSLFTVYSYLYSKNNNASFPFCAFDSASKLYSSKNIKSENDFNSIAEYKLVQIDTNGDWGVIELKQGQLGKYIFLITQNGEVYKIIEKGSFLHAIKAKNFPHVPLDLLRRSFLADQSFFISDHKGDLKAINYDHRVIINSDSVTDAKNIK